MDSKMWICRELMTIIKLSLIASELSETPRTHLLYHSSVYYLQLRQSSAVSCWEPGENSVECCNSPVSTVWCEGDEQRFSASGRGVRALSGNSLNIWLTSNISTGTPAGETWVLTPPTLDPSLPPDQNSCTLVHYRRPCGLIHSSGPVSLLSPRTFTNNSAAVCAWEENQYWYEAGLIDPKAV